MIEFLAGIVVGVGLTVGGLVWLSMYGNREPWTDPLFPSKGPPKR